MELRIHLSFFFLFIFVLWTDPAAHQSASAGPRSLALVGIIFVCVVAHELAHALVGMHAGIPAKAVILLPIGGVTLMDESRQTSQPDAQTWKRDMRIAMVGPVASLLIAFIAGSILLSVAPEIQLWHRPYVTSNNLLRSLVWINLFLGVFNLLPAYPLDGGRVLRAIFARKMDPVRATRRAVSIGQTFAMAFMFAGIWDVWLILVGLFLFAAAQLEERSAVFQSVLENVQLEDVMLTEFATLSPADTLEDALDKAVHSLQDDFPVIRGSDMVGVISKQKILEALRSEGNGYVQAVMNRIFEVAQKKETLASAFRKLTSRNLSIIPIVEDQRLVGIVTLQNLMHSMALLAESRKLRRDSLDQAYSLSLPHCGYFSQLGKNASETRPSTCTTAMASAGSPELRFSRAAAQREVRDVDLLFAQYGSDFSDYARHVVILHINQVGFERGLHVDSIDVHQARNFLVDDGALHDVLFLRGFQKKRNHAFGAAGGLRLLRFMHGKPARGGHGSGIYQVGFLLGTLMVEDALDGGIANQFSFALGDMAAVTKEISTSEPSLTWARNAPSLSAKTM